MLSKYCRETGSHGPSSAGVPSQIGMCTGRPTRAGATAGPQTGAALGLGQPSLYSGSGGPAPDRPRETERNSDRDTDRDRERQTERQKQRQREEEWERGDGGDRVGAPVGERN